MDLNWEAAGSKHLDHLVVGRQNLCVERSDAVLRGRLGEVGEQYGPETLPLEGVADGEGDLRAPIAGALVRAVPDDRSLGTTGSNEAVSIAVIDIDGPARRFLQVDGSGEEAEEDRVGREAAQERQKCVVILGAHRSYVNGRPVAQNDIGFAVDRIGNGHCGILNPRTCTTSGS